MSPEAMIAALDRGNEISGQDVVLRRESVADLTARATVRHYSPANIVGSIKQDDALVTMSPTEMRQAAWPAPPIRGDKIVIAGKVRSVEAVNRFNCAGVDVRFEIRVR